MNITPPIEETYLLPARCWSAAEIDHDGAVIHFISATNVLPNDPYNFDRIRQIFTDNTVSCHYYIDRDEKLWVFVNPKFKAYHAGKSNYRGQANLNNNFIGIEVAGTDGEPFNDGQYDTLAWLLRDLMKKYPGITTDTIKGHEQVSGPKVRSDYKPDPGIYFDWLLLGNKMQLLSMLLGDI